MNDIHATKEPPAGLSIVFDIAPAWIRNPVTKQEQALKSLLHALVDLENSMCLPDETSEAVMELLAPHLTHVYGGRGRMILECLKWVRNPL